MRSGRRIAVVIPALDEEESLGGVLAGIPRWVDRVLVGDNGSTDRTAAVAAAGGAEVVRAWPRGYGRACRAPLERLAAPGASAAPDVIVFLDGDGADDASAMERLVDPILGGEADLVIGARVASARETGALTLTQRLGNRAVCLLVSRLFGFTCTDLGPFRAVRWSSLQGLELDEPGFGWTIRMQVRAARTGLRVVEVPVASRRRKGGRSKVSGTLRGAVGAGATFARVIASEALRGPRRA